MSKINVINKCEIRTKENGDIVINGLLPTESYSEVMFNVKKRIFFKEIISRGAFDVILEKVTPKLIINHDYSKELILKSFEIFISRFISYLITIYSSTFISFIINEYDYKVPFVNFTLLSFHTSILFNPLIFVTLIFYMAYY